MDKIGKIWEAWIKHKKIGGVSNLNLHTRVLAVNYNQRYHYIPSQSSIRHSHPAESRGVLQ